MQEAIIRDFGGLTAVVNNAAGNFLAASETLSPNAFQAVVDIVLKGSFNTTRIAGEYWIGNNQPGKVLSIVTTYTETGCAFVLPSAAAKAGVQAMMNSLAYEWAPHGIRCNSIAPGPFPTEGAWSRLMPDEDFARHMTERHPMGRVGEREELANLAAFVLSDLAPYVNGETLTIDGGERLQGAQFNAIAQHMPREQLKAIFEHMKPTKK
jgi:NAD(P)-dependent dehydrogenase (short-subunit alcohol dehydrogenase family)